MSNANKNKTPSSVLPIYAVGGVWLLLSLLWPLRGLGRILTAVVVSAVVFVILDRFTRNKRKAKAEKAAEEEKNKPVSYGPQVDAVIAEGKRAQQELGRLYASISNVEIKKKIRDIMEVSDKIIQDAIDDPKDVPQIKKFLDYYLPTTIKLLNAYDRMGAQGIEGSNISGTMSSIEEMLDTAIAAYRKLLDSLFANQAMDIETDISVMNTLLKREGLSGTAGL